MKKLFISADFEGTAGVAHWDETEPGKLLYDHFAKQMSREVAAACEGALNAGYDEVFVKDAHDTARNIDPTMLPMQTRIFRGWGSHPFSMMAGIDESFSGAVFTGYHSAAGTDVNPLSHTMTTKNNFVTINGELCSELMMNSLTAAYVGVPVYCVCGDKGLCDWIQSVNPNIETVAVSEGFGNGSISIHPDLAVQRIRETVERAVRKNPADCMFPMPEHFHVEINYVKHPAAASASWYPGCVLRDAKTIAFDADDYMDVLRLIHFVL